MTVPAFRIAGVSFAYPPGAPVLEGCSLEIACGSLTGVAGPNGAGKSTLLALMTGLLRPRSGSIEVNGHPLVSLSRREVARTIAVVPQGEHSAFPFTVEEIVLMGRSPHIEGAFARETGEDLEIARTALREVGMERFRHRSVSSLSGGERQLVLIARALAQAAPILLLDEPTASLDLAHQQQILRIIERQVSERNMTAVVVTHDLNLAALYCGRIAILHGGRIAAEGPPAAVLREGLLAEVYGADVWLSEAPDGRPVVGLKR
ncbi:ABC transporter ATP-binding protein [Candidatus Poribacteria bacterium]|nr:ABC transporter ATP-binding protein [Candidatus Poribacteria bacterium]